MATCNYNAKHVHELSVQAGEPLRLLLGSDLAPSREWILCERERQLGRIGYIRRDYLHIAAIDARGGDEGVLFESGVWG